MGGSKTKRMTREAKLEFSEMGGSRFCHVLATRAGRSEIGPVGSQYADQLRANAPEVGALAFDACHSTVGAVSYGLHPEAAAPGMLTGRLDVVMVDPKCRGLGIGGLLMAHLFSWLAQAHGANLRHVSTMAVHPAVAAFVTRLGFELVGTERSPLYTVDLSEPEQRERFLSGCEKEEARRLATIKTQCLKCQRHSYVKPWCADSGMCPE